MRMRVGVVLFALVVMASAALAGSPARATLGLVPVDTAGGAGGPSVGLDSPPQAPRAGEYAPDFELPTYDGTGVFRLSSHRGARPVVLVFGSYT